SLCSTGVEFLDVGACMFELRGIGGGGLEGLEELFVGQRFGVGAEDLMESPLGALFGVGGVFGFGNFLGRKPRHDGGRDVAVALGLGDGVEDLQELGGGHRRRVCTAKTPRSPREAKGGVMMAIL